MSGCRILHCGTSLKNYFLCINKMVIGFTQRTADIGDIIYLSVKYNKKTLCGAKATISELTDYKPWEDAERYVQCFKVENMSYCKPFDLSILRAYGGKSWGPLYLQRSKLIKEAEAIERLQNVFNKNILSEPYIFEDIPIETSITEDLDIIERAYEPIGGDVDESNSEEPPLEIMGTFQTIKFKNETDRIRGLEPLVTKHFYQLFKHFNMEKTILIPENRLFITADLKNDKNESIIGIKSIPDALLISYDKSERDTPLKINLIEYECYGEGKYKTAQKFHYLNETIIPQLIRFASTFSIVTDNRIREETIQLWVKKIMKYRDDNDDLIKMTFLWMEELYPGIKERQIDLHLEKVLRDAFKSNIRIILVIDELTVEQKDTIKNVINSFKLDNSNIKTKNNFIEFDTYIVRLEQKIGIYDNEAEFALSFQQ